MLHEMTLKLYFMKCSERKILQCILPLKNLDKKVKEIHLLSTTTNDAQIKGTQQLKEVNDAIKFINEKLEEFEADRREKEQKIVVLKSTRKSLNVCLDKADRTLYRQEQYSRKNCLLIHGIVEENQENTDEVVINVLKEKWTRK